MVTTRSSKSKIPETPKEPEKMEVEKSEEAKAAEKRQLVVEDIKGHFKELEKAAQMKEPRQVAKVCPLFCRPGIIGCMLGRKHGKFVR